MDTHMGGGTQLFKLRFFLRDRTARYFMKKKKRKIDARDWGRERDWEGSLALLNGKAKASQLLEKNDGWSTYIYIVSF